MAAKAVPPDVLRKYDVENEIARYVDYKSAQGNTLLLQYEPYPYFKVFIQLALCTVQYVTVINGLIVAAPRVHSRAQPDHVSNPYRAYYTYVSMQRSYSY